MDEPFGALDAMTRQALQDEILRLIAVNRTTVVFVTHDLEEAIYLGDRVVALYPTRAALPKCSTSTCPRRAINSLRGSTRSFSTSRSRMRPRSATVRQASHVDPGSGDDTGGSSGGSAGGGSSGGGRETGGQHPRHRRQSNNVGG
jgi:ABC-type sugar transport system ATPase subunit